MLTALGLLQFMKLSGGLDGGSEPPAFQRAERERLMAKEAADESTENMDSTILPSPAENKSELLNVVSDTIFIFSLFTFFLILKKLV